jgi:NAD(P)-dependent dehydrogenase (short-subunit alcohol dehydrogenase family)
MMTMDISKLLRPGLLNDVSTLLVVSPETPSQRARGAAVTQVCRVLGARVSTCWPISDRSEQIEETALDAAVAAAVGEEGRIDLLVIDGAGLFAHALARGGDGHAALRTCMDAAWNATRAVVNHGFLVVAGEDGSPAGSGGRIVYLAPAPNAGEYAEAVCAGLENLGRTLSIEWARHGVNTVTIAPGAETPAGEVAMLVAYLASPAGSYFSGCLLDLRGP